MPFFRKKKRSLSARIASSKPYLFIAGWLLRGIAQLLYSTLRVECKGLQELNTPCIIALWHNQLVLAPLLRKLYPQINFSVVVSKSRDGLLLGAFIKTYSKTSVIHVGHTSRHGALLEIVDELKKNHVVIITPDGPRGPLYEVKGGVAFSAVKAESAIIPLSWQASKFWQLKTWDRLRFPKPFSKITLSFEEPIQCHASSDIAQIQNTLQQKLQK